MEHESLFNRDWAGIVERLGGADALEAGARQTRAMVRARMIKSSTDLLRMLLAYCLGDRGLRSTTAWAASVGLVDISNVSLLHRLRHSGDWLALLVGQVLAEAAPKGTGGRLIRIIDGTTVPKPGPVGGRNQLWRIHAAFDLPTERFGAFLLTEETGGETLDRIAAVKGEIRLADRAFLQPDRMAAILDVGADFVIRSGWKGARWLTEDGKSFDLIATLAAANERELIDRPIWLKRKSATPLGLRLVAVKKPPDACTTARQKAARESQRGGHRLAPETLVAADWVILITSLAPAEFPAADLLALYRLRWRIELAFKRLKSLIGLKGPPGADPRTARPYILAHLLMILLLEPLIDEFEASPRLDPSQNRDLQRAA